MLEDDEIRLPQEYSDFCLMRTMHWDYYTFEKQPDYFIYLCKKYIDAENRANDRMKLRNKNK